MSGGEWGVVDFGKLFTETNEQKFSLRGVRAKQLPGWLNVELDHYKPHAKPHRNTYNPQDKPKKSAASYQLTDSPSTAYNPNKYRTANSRTLSWSFSVCRAASWSADVKAGVFLSRSFSARVFSTIFFSTATAFSSCSGVRPLSPI